MRLTRYLIKSGLAAMGMFTLFAAVYQGAPTFVLVGSAVIVALGAGFSALFYKPQ